MNKQHLHNNKVLLKTPYNKNIPNFPSKLVSEDLSNVLQKIVGKGMPTYDDLNKLSDEERLHSTSLRTEKNKGRRYIRKMQCIFHR